MELNINEILNKNGLSPDSIIELSKRFKPIELKKNDYFIKYGEKMNIIGILYQGVLVSRYIDDNGKKATSKFYYPNGDIIVADYFCFKNQMDSTENIQAIENSILLTLSFNDYQLLIKEYPSIQRMVSEYSEQSYLKALNRIRDFQLLNAEQRVKKFINSHRKVSNKLSIKDKASYLGLSRNVFTEKMKKI